MTEEINQEDKEAVTAPGESLTETPSTPPSKPAEENLPSEEKKEEKKVDDAEYDYSKR